MLLKSLLQSVEFILSKMENGVGYCKPIMKRDLGTWDFKIKKKLWHTTKSAMLICF